PTDVLVRYGGEEFFAALFDMPQDRVFSNLERLRKSIENHQFVYKHQEMKLTISIGVTSRDYSMSSDTNLAEIIAEADHALYQAKTSGRNQTRIYSAGMKNALDNLQIDIFAPPQ
ncbi:MAG: GGDEF domain-containing protein, partial [Candidatus Cloacimonadaceae bacterium]|nr:GGDEF domain-containing protein [Candidatus Cloacimonadaceae bacterium]